MIGSDERYSRASLGSGVNAKLWMFSHFLVASVFGTALSFISPILVAPTDVEDEPPRMYSNVSADSAPPHDHFDPPITWVRLHVTPLDGATYLWHLFRPFIHPLGNVLSHPHVIISDEGYPTVHRPRYRVIEYHPDEPPLIAIIYGSGRMESREFSGWIPRHRTDGRYYAYAEHPALPLRRFSDVLAFKEMWGDTYDLSDKNCQRFAVELTQYLTGVSYGASFWHGGVPTAIVVICAVLVFTILLSVIVLRALDLLHRAVLRRRSEQVATWASWRPFERLGGGVKRRRVLYKPWLFSQGDLKRHSLIV